MLGEEGFESVKQLLVGGGHGSDEESVDATRSDGFGASKATGRSEVERPMILDRAVDGGDSVVVGKTTGTSGVVWREGRADELSRDPRIPWDCAGGDGNGGRRDGLAVLMLPGFSTACTGFD